MLATSFHAFGDENDFTSTDVTAMDVVGYEISSPPPSPPPQPPTNAALIQLGNGQLDYLGFAGINLVGSDLVSYTSWSVVAEGDFNHNGVMAVSIIFL